MLLMLALACASDTDTGENAPPVRTDDTAEDCSGNDPEITSFTLGNGGMVDFDGTLYATIQLQLDANDLDGNLDSIVLEMWWEGDGDGQVDTSRSPDNDKSWALVSDAACEIFSTEGSPANIALNLQVGGAIDPNTLYDFAVRVTDASGEISAPALATGVTPKSDGSDGDPQ